MKEKNNKNKTNKQLAQNPLFQEPEFMNDVFCLFLKIINFLTAVYIIGSFILYLVIHFHGKDLFKSKKSYTMYDRLLFLNLFYDMFLSFTILISYVAISRKSIVSFVIYFALMILACTFGFYGFTNDYSNLNTKIRYFVLTICGLNVLFFVYPIFHYLRKIQYFRVSLESFPVENIIHEVKLRTDMVKMSFNNLVIKFKLHKILPSITYKKEDYYFLSEECKNRMAYRPLNKDEVKEEVEEKEKESQCGYGYASKSTEDGQSYPNQKLFYSQKSN